MYWMKSLRSLIYWQVYQESTAMLWNKLRLTEEQDQH